MNLTAYLIDSLCPHNTSEKVMGFKLTSSQAHSSVERVNNGMLKRTIFFCCSMNGYCVLKKFCHKVLVVLYLLKLHPFCVGPWHTGSFLDIINKGCPNNEMFKGCIFSQEQISPTFLL